MGCACGRPLPDENRPGCESVDDNINTVLCGGGRNDNASITSSGQQLRGSTASSSSGRHKNHGPSNMNCSSTRVVMKMDGNRGGADRAATSSTRSSANIVVINGGSRGGRGSQLQPGTRHQGQQQQRAHLIGRPRRGSCGVGSDDDSPGSSSTSSSTSSSSTGSSSSSSSSSADDVRPTESCDFVGAFVLQCIVRSAAFRQQLVGPEAAGEMERLWNAGRWIEHDAKKTLDTDAVAEHEGENLLAAQDILTTASIPSAACASAASQGGDQDESIGTAFRDDLCIRHSALRSMRLAFLAAYAWRTKVARAILSPAMLEMQEEDQMILSERQDEMELGAEARRKISVEVDNDVGHVTLDGEETKWKVKDEDIDVDGYAAHEELRVAGEKAKEAYNLAVTKRAAILVSELSEITGETEVTRACFAFVSAALSSCEARPEE
ncbi:unnamed protein product, partial [Amoebophrya sp. A25]|eukprot:GSA25T00018664001.1